MGTRSTVKFFTEDGKNVLSLYQQYDGYPEGVGQQIYDLIKNIKIVNGFSFGDKIFKVANGIEDLALQYVVQNKTDIGNLYATTVDDQQEYNYEIIEIDDGELKIKVYEDYEEENVLFEGTRTEFLKYIEGVRNEGF